MEGHYDNRKPARPIHESAASRRERANAEAFAAVFGPESLEEGSDGSSATLLDEDFGAIDAPSAGHVGQSSQLLLPGRHRHPDRD